ncbi:hypothetical protein [Streptomyces sp. SID1121]|uniref:hypothetical protein n=1 Tax=Streptomyces sp. SID1121 TaxID=3425888 RepID=UPI004056063F
MLEAGESAATLARWLGHSSPAITLRYYAHFMPEAGRRGQAAIDGLLGGTGRWADRPKLPRFSPGPLAGNSRCYPSVELAMNYKVEETDGPGKCSQKSMRPDTSPP